MKKWIEKEGDPAVEATLVQSLGISPLMARLLVNRNIKSVEEARPFLNGTIDDLHDPFLMKDMDKAVERIRRAVDGGERVVIYGDYDVDGITGAALLYKALTVLGVEADHFVPDRLSDGYGINEKAVRSLANYDLMVSVDCGISDISSIRLAGELGLDVVVTDHHQVPSTLPPAYAVLNPKREDCPYPYPYLSGVGVAYKLAIALLADFGKNKQIAADWLDLVALGTVADVVPLVGENRILVKEGLDRLQKPDNTGIRTLKVVSSVENVGIYEVGYLLAPRINAASRMGKAGLAYTLMTSSDEIQCAAIARELDSLNNQRKSIEQKIFDDARYLLDKEPEGQKAVILSSDGWHPGVTGIVASKLKEETNRPVVLVCWGDNNTGKGTARSISNFPITSALSRCGDFLESYGGHDAAAGFTIRRESWEAFRIKLQEIAQQDISEEDLIKKIFFDQEIDLGDHACDIIKQIEQLYPFGIKNPEPVFSSRGLKPVGTPREVGKNHLKLALRQGSCTYNAIGFRMADRLLPLLKNKSGRCSVDVAYSLRKNLWRGEESIQLHLKDLNVY